MKKITAADGVCPADAKAALEKCRERLQFAANLYGQKWREEAEFLKVCRDSLSITTRLADMEETAQEPGEEMAPEAAAWRLLRLSDCFDKDDMPALEAAISALEIRTPMKPMAATLCPSGRTALPCGRCGESLDAEGLFCRWCGQRIMWEGEE